MPLHHPHQNLKNLPKIRRASPTSRSSYYYYYSFKMSDNFSNFSFGYDYVTFPTTTSDNKPVIPKTTLRSDGPRPFPQSSSSWTTSTANRESTVTFLLLETTIPSTTTKSTSGPTYKW